MESEVGAERVCVARFNSTGGMISTSFGLMIEKRRERGLIYRRGWGVMDGAVMALMIVVDVGVEVCWGLAIELEIRAEFGFVGSTVCVQGGGRAGLSDLCDIL